MRTIQNKESKMDINTGNRIDFKKINQLQSNKSNQNETLSPNKTKLFSEVETSESKTDTFTYSSKKPDDNTVNTGNDDVQNKFLELIIQFLEMLLKALGLMEDETGSKNDNTTTNPDGSKSVNNYNSDGELINSTQYDKNGTKTGSIEYKYAYDNNGEKYISSEASKDAKGNLTTLTRRYKDENFNDVNTTTYEYDSEDRLIKTEGITKNENGETISYARGNSDGVLYYAEAYDNRYSVCPSNLSRKNSGGVEHHTYKKIRQGNIEKDYLSHSEYYEKDGKTLKYTIDYDENFNQYVKISENGKYQAPQYSYPNSKITAITPNGTKVIYTYDEKGVLIP